MSESKNPQIPQNWNNVVDTDAFSKCVSRISYEILERNTNLDKLAIVGVRTGGELLARRIHERIKKIENVELDFGVIDITLYRDDLSQLENQPILKGTELPFAIEGTTIVLIDDVLFTGRNVRASLDAITDFGRPNTIQLAVLVDRGHRELPIRPDYVGKNVPTSKSQIVDVMFKENDGVDGVFIHGNQS